MAYLLPCPKCDRKLVVTTGEAGGQARCECGTAVDVPTVRGLRELAQAAGPAEEGAKSWSARQSLMFLGSLVAIAGVAFGVIQHLRAAEAYPGETFADKIRQMPAADSWSLWTQLSQMGVGNWQPPKDEKQLSALKDYEEIKSWEYIGFGVAGVGLVLVVIGVTMSGAKRPIKSKPPPRPVRKQPKG